MRVFRFGKENNYRNLDIFMRALAKRYTAESIDGLALSKPIRYERYYINDNLRVQKKGHKFQREILDDQNNISEKTEMTKDEFSDMKEKAYAEIVRDSYVYLNDNRTSIKEYHGKHKGLLRVEVLFNSIDEEKIL